jgi:hypothetical protein
MAVIRRKRYKKKEPDPQSFEETNGCSMGLMGD